MNKPNKNRIGTSYRYQWRYLEIPVADYDLALLTNADGLAGTFNPIQYSEELLDLKAELNQLTLELVYKLATPTQLKVFQLMATGMSQTEVGREIEMLQCNVHQHLFGRQTSAKSGPRHKVGGLFKKIRLAMAQDPRIQDLLAQIEELTVPNE